MATVTRQVCDLCQQQGSVRDADVLRISLGGQAHEADLCSSHTAQITEALAPFTKAMRTSRVQQLTRQPREPRERCPGCGRRFTGQGLASHVRACQSDGFVYECDYDGCDYDSLTSQGLAMHRYRAHNIRRADCVNCPHCKASFIQPDALSAHLAKEHHS